MYYIYKVFTRVYEPLDSRIQPNKVLIIYGPRRVGKTTLLHKFLQNRAYHYKLDSGDNIRTQQILGSQDFSLITQYAEGYDLIAIDEAQNIPHVGMGLKILVDQSPGIRVIATGSSSFELAGQTGEPLTGRKRTITLFPLAQMELLSAWNRFELREKLPDFLIYGTYPEVLIAPTRQERIEVLTELTQSYLLKDILALDRVKNSRTLMDLLKLLAFQIGNVVAIHELANTLGIDAKTVKRYLDLLEQTFVIVRLGGFSRNLRQEISNKAKYYFLDNGVRNALIANFNTLDLRNDQGALWENFVLMERLKFRTYNGIHGGMYFWRTYQQQEIDLIEERDGTLFAFECKWSEKHKTRVPPTWIQAYPDTSFKVINPENYQEFVFP